MVHVWRLCLAVALACGVAVGAPGEDTDDGAAEPASLTITGFKDYPVQTYTKTGMPDKTLSKDDVADPASRIEVQGFYNRSKLILIGLDETAYYYVHRDDVVAADEEALHNYTRKKGRGLVCLPDPRQVAKAQPSDTQRGYTKGLKENPCN